MPTRIHFNNHVIIISFVLVSGFFVFIALASSPFDIKFPVRELGNCQDQNACRTYCDQPENVEACFTFAKKHSLAVSEKGDREDHEKLDKFAEVIKDGGPGGCTTFNQCQTYCDDTNNIEECLRFADEHDLLPEEELRDGRKAARLLRENKKLPGNCRNHHQCEQYCQAPAHQEECLAFAEEEGFISPEEAVIAKKALGLMERGETPGSCRTQEQCMDYCSQDNHIDECADFGVKAGLMKPGEVQGFKKARGKGPGGCQGHLECQKFCNNPANQEVCFKFAEEHGFIPKEQIKEIKENAQKFRGETHKFPSEIEACLRGTLGPELFEKMREGTLAPGREIGEQVKKCFEFRPSFPPNTNEGGVMMEEKKCVPRPACLDTEPRCLPPEPAEGWCQWAPSGEKSLPSEFSCPREYNPVCGNDHVTYPNECVAKLKSVSVAYPGICKGNHNIPPSTSEPRPEACVACAAPPPGCYYEGGSCYSCGKLVCKEYPSPSATHYPSPSPEYKESPYPSPYPTGETRPQSSILLKIMATLTRFLLGR